MFWSLCSVVVTVNWQTWLWFLFYFVLFWSLVQWIENKIFFFFLCVCFWFLFLFYFYGYVFFVVFCFKVKMNCLFKLSNIVVFCLFLFIFLFCLFCFGVGQLWLLWTVFVNWQIWLFFSFVLFCFVLFCFVCFVLFWSLTDTVIKASFRLSAQIRFLCKSDWNPIIFR